MVKYQEFKPNRESFVKFNFYTRFIISASFFLILFFVLKLFIQVSPLFFIGIFILTRIWVYFSLKVSYNKTKYLIYTDRIIRKGGGIFSDTEVELRVRNITHVKMRLPLIRNKLYGTGSVIIESAGTSAAEVIFSDLDDAEKIYEYMQELMKHNGFSLKKSKLIQRENPSKLGAFFESTKGLFSFILIVLVIATSIMDDFDYSIIDLFNSYGSIAFPVLLLFLGGYLIYAILYYLDLKQRVYEIYSDTIIYSEGFLHKNYSFMPIENLADSSLTQTIVDKIFNLNDVKISCQGSGKEVHFKNIVNGPKVSENIDKLISKTQSLISLNKLEKTSSKKQKSLAYSTPKPKANNTFTAEFKMDMKRTIIPLLIFLPIFPLFLVFFITQFVTVESTRYFVKKNSIEKKFNFLSKKDVEFSNDKIVSIIFKESFIDKWFNTCSIDFWSIGSQEKITFKNIKKTSQLYSNILAKSGISKEEVIYNMDSNFNLGRMVKSNIIFSITLLLGTITLFVLGSLIASYFFLIGGILVSLIILLFIYKKIYYDRSKLKFHKNFIHFKKGIFFISEYYTLYDNIKDIATLKYPFESSGNITFNVAGEQLIQNGKSAQMISNSYTIKFIDEIETKDELIDIIFYQRPSRNKISGIEKKAKNYSAKVLMKSKPDIANPVFGTVGILTLLIITIPLIPVIIPFVIWATKVKSYTIEDYRVVARWGIIYKKQTSIMFNRVDHVNSSQGALNKLFKNGNVIINTAGSSMPEITIRNIKDYEKFYELLKKRY